MRWNALLQPSFEHEAATQSTLRQQLHQQQQQQQQNRWWLGWLQLLCAWVLCMLLCANIALVLRTGFARTTQEKERCHVREAGRLRGHGKPRATRTGARGTGRSVEGVRTGVLSGAPSEFLPCNNRVTVDNDAGVIARRIGPFP
jgi:hypothetical protein